MRIAQFVPTFGLLVVLGLAGLGGGCSSGSTPMAKEDSEKLRESRKGAHQQLKEAKKAAAKQIEEERQKLGALRKGAHGRGGGR
jgi:hypothetical protein